VVAERGALANVAPRAVIVQIASKEQVASLVPQSKELFCVLGRSTVPFSLFESTYRIVPDSRQTVARVPFDALYAESISILRFGIFDMKTNSRRCNH